MIWKPTKAQLNIIADMGTARMTVEAVAKAVGVGPDEFRTWRAKLSAAAVAEEMAERVVPKPKPREVRPRVMAERVVESGQPQGAFTAAGTS